MRTDLEADITAPDVRARSGASDSPDALEKYLRSHIPLAEAMDVRVERADPDGILLSAPLAPNINHRDTVFGGSASALAILAGWALVHVRLSRDWPNPHRIVIQRNEIEYLAPIEERFQARALAPDNERWDRFLRTLRRWSRGRIEMTCELLVGDEVVGRLTGQYVTLPVGDPGG